MKQQKPLTVKDVKNVGGLIRTIRVAKKVSQTELAEKMQISNAHLSRIETGEKRAGLSILIKFCKATDLELILQQK
jgi:transcriptional regulator with XRE-family HTH domain